VTAGLMRGLLDDPGVVAEDVEGVSGCAVLSTAPAFTVSELLSPSLFAAELLEETFPPAFTFGEEPVLRRPAREFERLGLKRFRILGREETI